MRTGRGPLAPGGLGRPACGMLSEHVDQPGTPLFWERQRVHRKHFQRRWARTQNKMRHSMNRSAKLTAVNGGTTSRTVPPDAAAASWNGSTVRHTSCGNVIRTGRGPLAPGGLGRPACGMLSEHADQPGTPLFWERHRVPRKRFQGRWARTQNEMRHSMNRSAKLIAVKGGTTSRTVPPDAAAASCSGSTVPRMSWEMSCKPAAAYSRRADSVGLLAACLASMRINQGLL